MPGQTACKECPETHYCPTGATTGLFCHGGFYMDHDNDGKCVPCKAGHFCELGEQKKRCEAGTWAEAGQDHCAVCPAGYFCEEACEEPKPCEKADKCSEGSKKNKK